MDGELSGFPKRANIPVFFFWKHMPPQRVEKEHSALQIRYGTQAKGTGPLERVGTEGTDEVSDSL